MTSIGLAGSAVGVPRTAAQPGYREPLALSPHVGPAAARWKQGSPVLDSRVSWPSHYPVHAVEVGTGLDMRTTGRSWAFHLFCQAQSRCARKWLPRLRRWVIFGTTLSPGDFGPRQVR
jgi:hypothetical protein